MKTKIITEFLANKLFLSTLFVLLAVTMSTAQISGQDALNLLKEEALIVSLYTNSKAIVELDKLIASDKIKDKQKKKLIENRDKRKQSIDAVNKATIEAFQRHYTYGDVVFVPDALLDSLISGRRDSISYNVELELLPDTIPNGDRFVYVKRGMNELHFTIQGHDQLDIADGFVTSSKFNHFKPWDAAGNLIGTDDMQQVILSKLEKPVKYINSKITNYRPKP